MIYIRALEYDELGDLDIEENPMRTTLPTARRDVNIQRTLNGGYTFTDNGLTEFQETMSFTTKRSVTSAQWREYQIFFKSHGKFIVKTKAGRYLCTLGGMNLRNNGQITFNLTILENR